MTEFATLSGGGSGVSSVNGQSGAIVARGWMGHRLTLVTATPVMTASQTAIGTHFVTPYQGDQIPLYDGTNIIPTTFAEVSQAASDATKSPAAVVNNSVYDVFAWNDAGTLRATRGPPWTSDTARSAGTALVMVNGILLNNASITNGPAAQRGTYIGSLRSNGTATWDYIFGSSASGGGAALLHVWNNYNRKLVTTAVVDTQVLYTYTSNVIRQAAASATNQASFLCGLAEDGIYAYYGQSLQLVAAIAALGTFGVGFDSTTTLLQERGFVYNNQGATITLGAAGVSVAIAPQLGRHIVSANERGDNVNANGFNQQNAGTLILGLPM